MSDNLLSTKQFRCEFCPGKGSNTFYGWRQHILSSKHIENVKGIQTKKEELKVTQPINNNKTFKCEHCNKLLSSKYNLTRHITVCKIANSPKVLLHSNEESTNMTIVVNTNKVNNTTDNIQLIVNHHIYNYLMMRVNNVLKYNIFNNHWGTNSHILPLGFENDSHLSKKDITLIHSSGQNSFKKYIELLYVNTANHNIYRTNINKNEYKYITANGQIKRNKWADISVNIANNMVTMFNNFIENKNIIVEEQYKKELQKIKDLLTDMTDSLFKKFTDTTETQIINYSEASKINIDRYQQDNPKLIGTTVSDIVIPSTDTWVEF